MKKVIGVVLSVLFCPLFFLGCWWFWFQMLTTPAPLLAAALSYALGTALYFLWAGKALSRWTGLGRASLCLWMLLLGYPLCWGAMLLCFPPLPLSSVLIAFETAAEAVEREPDARTARALGILARKAGIYGMIGGQVVDVESEGQPLSREKLDFIYRLKTSALIESSMTIGAVLAGAGEEAVRAVERVAGDVGLAFQIQDDILDVTSTLEVLGKPIHSDDKNQKTTYVTLEGLEKARKDVAEISARALETLSALECRNVFLEELIRMLITREK